jgi:hypothetical protein
VRRSFVALAFAAGAAVGAAGRGADADLTALEPRVGRLEALTQRVEALAAVKRLQHAYGHYSELGLWHDFAELFADTGIGYYTQGALDREGIRTLFVKEVGQGRLGLADGRIYPHISMQPVITLAADGRSAKGRWRIMAMLGGYGTGASWAGGVYENQYVLERGVWKMQEVRYLPQYSGRYDAPGWTPTRQPAPVHYEASRVGRPILDVPAAGSSAVEAASRRPELRDLARRMATVASRAQQLADEIEVTNLQHAYGYYADRRMWDDVADLFAADGTMEIGLQGVYAGRASVRRGLNALGRQGMTAGEINDHVHLQTIVTVSPDGRTARARGTDLGMIGSPGGRPLWTQSIYENEYVKQDGRWKFKVMHVYPRFSVDAERGWANDAQPAPAPSREFPPDRPATERYDIYPRFHIAPLHFDHPVTGRPPQYPAGTVAAARSAVASPPAPALPTTIARLEALVASTERSVQRSHAYHAAENLAAAHGFSLDEPARAESNTFVLHQVVQPVIHVAPDARSARVRARAFQLGNVASGEGNWLSGIYEGTASADAGGWTLAGMNLTHVWTAPSRGGWVRVAPSPVTVPFHYRNPVSGRKPPLLVP